MKKVFKGLLVLMLLVSVLTGCTTSDNNTVKFDKEVDLLVLGGGGAGLAAAIEAKDNGVGSVTVVEKLANIGGTTFISQGMIAGYDTKVQKAEGSVPTDFDQMYANLMSNALYRLDKDLTGITVKQSKETIDWLVDRMKVTFNQDVLVGYGPLEMMHVVTGGGPGLLDPFTTALSDAGIEVLTETTAYDLIVDEFGAVIGAKCKTKDQEITIGAKAVIIATGGYANNPELTQLLDPEFKGTFGIGFGACTGDGIIMANNVGAALTHTNHLMAVLKDYEIMSEYSGDSNTANVSRYVGMTNTVLVGKEGTRFVDEKSGGYMTQELNRPIFSQMHKDGTGFVWAINDTATLEANKIVRGKNMQFISADTIAELATKMNVPTDKLEKTINDYNAYVAAKFDPEFGRTVMSELKAPYTAVAIVPCEIITYGGVARNEWAEVVRADNSIISGLYVAGEAGANSAYMGFTISNAFSWGRIAGSNAADYILGKPKKDATIIEEKKSPKVRFDMSIALTDGEYSAEVSGQEGNLVVKTVITNGKIATVEIVDNKETQAIAASALESIPQAIVANNSVDVDVQSGATLTSNRIMDAVAECLTQASK